MVFEDRMVSGCRWSLTQVSLYHNMVLVLTILMSLLLHHKLFTIVITTIHRMWLRSLGNCPKGVPHRPDTTTNGV